VVALGLGEIDSNVSRRRTCVTVRAASASKTTSPHSHGEERLHQRILGSRGVAVIDSLAALASGSARRKSCQFGQTTSPRLAQRIDDLGPAA
jgi:hypothetical protein